ncbi:TetR family transcriptional regulator [Hyphomicrobiales bacterium]|nr:TetR family transcriptional regulator [Hyphomicrobiales bacterium]
MSPGNLYRYFPSKDAIVTGLVERDRAMLREDFESFAQAERLEVVLRALARKHFEEAPRSKAVLCVQIWSEATVNPAIAAANATLDSDLMDGIQRLIAAGRDRGEVAEGVDAVATARLIMSMSNGLFLRRALFPDFDADNEIQALLCVIGGVLRGDIPQGGVSHLPSEGILLAAETDR